MNVAADNGTGKLKQVVLSRGALIGVWKGRTDIHPIEEQRVVIQTRIWISTLVQDSQCIRIGYVPSRLRG